MSINRKQKNQSKLKPFVIIGLLIIFATIVSGIFFTLHRNKSTRMEDARISSFSFDGSKAPEWWSGGSANPRAGVSKDYIGNVSDLPVADIALHQGKRESVGNCFVSYAYYDSDIDVVAAIERKERQAVTGKNTLSLKKIAVIPLKLQTSKGGKEYQMHQYAVEGAYQETLMRGIEFGYLQLAHGYIEVDGNCNLPKQLSETSPALKSVQFNEVAR